ncbi:MAG: hypothetical protein U5L45_22880 [Saprospiraceae bacterium]|nr:hypothetical protein [Saprospiraceae bacterium]
MVHFSGFARKMNHLSPFGRAKRAQKCLLMRIFNLCMVSKLFWETFAVIGSILQRL